VGPNTFDALSPLEAWVEKDIAPEQIIGSGNVAGAASKKMTRPLCAYPNIARYKGTGDPNNAANFQCVAATSQR